MTLNAYVQIDPVESNNSTQTTFSEGNVAVAQKIAPAWVEIVEDETGATLLQYDLEGTFVAETCHKNVEEAKLRAQKEFGIFEKNWFEER